MLLGQDLSWRHERGLEAGFHGEQHCRDCDNSFAGTNIALQQTVHRPVGRKITTQLVDHAHLRVRQIERQTSQKFLEQGASAAMRLSAAGGSGRSSRCDQHLHREELGEDEMLASRVKIRLACRKMDLLQRGDSFPEIDSRRQKRFDRVLRQDFRAPGKSIRETSAAKVPRSPDKSG